MVAVVMAAAVFVVFPPGSKDIKQYKDENGNKYHAYLAMSQIANQSESELSAYHMMKEQYAAMNHTRMLHKLEEYETDTADQEWMNRWLASGVRDDAMHELGGGTMAVRWQQPEISRR